jgi:PilZ domain-containing protein
MQQFDSFERRRTDRRLLDATGKASFAADLKIVNVGPRGIEVETRERLMIGAEYDVEIRSRGEEIEVRGTVVWSRLDRTVQTAAGDLRPVYRSGIEASSQSIPGLERLLDHSPQIDA